MPDSTAATAVTTTTTTPTPTTDPGAPTNITALPSPAGDGAQPRRRADQDQEIANTLSQARQVVGVVTNDPVIRAKLKGFDTQKLTEAEAVCDVADEKFAERQAAMGNQRAKAQIYQRLFNDRVKALSDFRETCRVAFPANAAALQALNVTDAVPDDLQKFLTHGRTAFTNAKLAEYNAKLAGFGYTKPKLDQELAAVEALDQADRDHATAMSDAAAATTARDAAVAPVRALRSQVLRLARRQFRKEPELLRKLDF